jgi:hypothetical protein
MGIERKHQPTLRPNGMGDIARAPATKAAATPPRRLWQRTGLAGPGLFAPKSHRLLFRFDGLAGHNRRQFQSRPLMTGSGQSIHAVHDPLRARRPI